ncbi:ABC transporter [Actinoplanes sp. NBRC 14428]|uniref:ATP-binding cassette subfamily B protein/ATP-binding cassette subfamily C protein n=2 Tax=Pseudosporangium ferrugineum TaxID=439699 RepID=A0A2T0SJQ9_9ACTN|nr:ATP-binding cassette subfamily B protein/ATP-binding cassette subfamily C protein [Pseudosporangium ferrugineum]BCJ56390.1 ABC transporter [Actinoplanes sp. NBRC 14428]
MCPPGTRGKRKRPGVSGDTRGRARGADTLSGMDARRVGLPALLPYLREHARTLAAVAALSLVGAAAALAQPVLVRTVLDDISAGHPAAAGVALLVALLITGAAIGGIRDFLLQRTAEGVVLTTRRRLAGHLLRLPIAEYDARRTGDLLSRVGADTTLLRAVVTSGLLEIVTGVVMVTGATIAMAVLDPLLLGVAAAGLAVGMSVAITASRRVRALSQRAQERLGEMTSAVERSISAVRTIRAAGAEEREARTVGRSAAEAYDAGMRVARLEVLIGPAATAATQGAFLLVLGVGGARAASGAITVGELVAFIMFLFFLVLPLGQALSAYTRLQTGLGALQRIEEILDLPAESAGDVAAVPDAAGAADAVAFEHVSFAYPGGGEVLHDVSFTVPRGSRVALVGPSGAGKSTTLALIERFYEVSDGTIRVDGTDIRQVPRAGLRAKLGYVEQEAPVLAGTLRDNLLLTAPGADDARLLAALGEVNLGGLVARAPEGLDVQVGEGGVLLSGGERQRLAIARALLAGSPILLLDEPTSNLDARNEAALREAIATASVRRTLVVVAHRLSTVIDSDRIIVLEGGRVVAQGTHRELLDLSPLYRELAAHQLLVP